MGNNLKTLAGLAAYAAAAGGTSLSLPTMRRAYMGSAIGSGAKDGEVFEDSSGRKYIREGGTIRRIKTNG